MENTMFNLKTASTLLVSSLMAFQCLGSDFNGAWKLRSEKDASKAVFTFEEGTGELSLNILNNLKVKCDELSFEKKEMGILKRGQVSDAVLICKADDDGASAVYSINYLNDERSKVVFRNIEDGDDIQELEKEVLDLVKSSSKSGTLNKFVISSDEDNAYCKRIDFTKTVDSKIWNSPVTYFCDIEEDPDSSAIIGVNKDGSKGQILLIQDLGDEEDLLLNKI